MVQEGKVVDRLEGADVASLTSKVNQLCPAVASGGRSVMSTSGNIAPTAASKHTDLAAATERVKKLIGSQPVMLFMKGTPDAPRCGFSSRTVAALRKSGVPFGHFDILSDEAVRQAAKVDTHTPSMAINYVDQRTPVMD
jgi:glutaredoxin-related protein